MAQDYPWMTQDGRRIAQDGPGMAPGWPKDAPRIIPEWPRMALGQAMTDSDAFRVANAKALACPRWPQAGHSLTTNRP
jgi:hypothetical protein